MRTFLPFLILAAWTALALTAAAPSIVGGDSPELTAAAHHLGIAHSPGYPLYSILGKSAQLLPIGDMAFRMTFLSICAHAGAFWVLLGLFRKWQTTEGSEDGSLPLALAMTLLLLGGTLTFRQVLSPEVLAVHFLLMSLLLSCLLFPTTRTLGAAAFLGGLGLAHHHLVLLVAPALLWTFRGHLRNPKLLAYSFTWGLLGLSVNLLLPLRAAQEPLVAWGSPTHWDQFLFVLTRGQYGGNIASGAFLDGFSDLYLFLAAFLRETRGFGPAFLVLGAWKARRSIPSGYWIGLAGLWILHPFLIRTPYDPQNNSINEAFLPAALLWTMPLVLKGAEAVLAALPRFRTALLAALIVLAAGSAFFSARSNDTSRNLAVTDIAVNILKQLPRGSALYSDGDAITFPLAYLILVQGKRPDLAVFDRTGGLFTDLYHILDHRRDGHLPIHEMLLTERTYELRQKPPAAYYTEIDRIPGRAVSMTGLLFQVAEGDAVIREAPWESFREPRIEPFHDFLSRETAARQGLFRASHLLAAGDPQGAKRELQEAKRLAHDNSRVLVNAGVAENGQGWVDEAARTFETACRISPRFELAWYDRGFAEDTRGRTQAALECFERAVELAPDNPDFRNRLAFQYYKSGRLSDAQREWEAVLRLAPGYAEVYRNLASLQQMQRPDLAAGLFRQYLRLAPNAPERPSIEKWLSERQKQ